MADKNGFTVGNAVGVLSFMGGLGVIATGVIIAVQITKDWTTGQTNLLILTCGTSFVVVAAGMGVFFGLLAYSRAQNRFASPPPTHLVPLDRQRSLPRRMIGPGGHYGDDPLPLISTREDEGTFDMSAYAEDYAE